MAAAAAIAMVIAHGGQGPIHSRFGLAGKCVGGGNAGLHFVNQGLECLHHLPGGCIVAEEFEHLRLKRDVALKFCQTEGRHCGMLLNGGPEDKGINFERIICRNSNSSGAGRTPCILLKENFSHNLGVGLGQLPLLDGRVVPVSVHQVQV